MAAESTPAPTSAPETGGARQRDALDGDAPVEVQAPGMLESLATGEIDMQVRTAKSYPRSIRKFTADCVTMATFTEEVAASCLYALPRAGKSIEGPSVRLAEIVASAWGNCRAGGRVVAVHLDEGVVVAQGSFYDVERNYAVTFETRRRITGRDGKVYNEDMIATTGNAAAGIAMRNAVFKGVPKAYWGPGYQAARECALGKAKDMATKRRDMVAAFAKMSVQVEQLLAAAKKPSLDDLTEDDLLMLRGVFSAIKEGETTIELAFPVAPQPAAAPGRKSDKKKAERDPGED